jgi:hypothetical protein
VRSERDKHADEVGALNEQLQGVADSSPPSSPVDEDQRLE